MSARIVLLFLLLSSWAWAATATIHYRENPAGSTSVLLAVDSDAEARMDEVRLRLPKPVRATISLGKGPQGWAMQTDGDGIRVGGPAIPNGRLRLRLDVGSDELPSEIRVSVLSAGETIGRQELRPGTLPSIPVAATLEDFAVLPAVVEPGEEMEFTPFDLSKTPPEGQWSVNGVRAHSAANGGVSVQIPADSEPGAPLAVRYEDPWGAIVVDVAALADVSVVATPQYREPGPRVTGCSRRTFAGQIACVCGSFPQGMGTQLLLDGRPLGVPLSASRRVLHVRLPQDAAPGAHIVEASTDQGFSASDQAMIVALGVNGSIDQSKLVRGESTELRLEVLGTNEPLTVRLENRTPQIVQLEGGDRQSVPVGGTSGGIVRKVDALTRGDFDIRYSLEDADCPCSGTDETNRTEDGYIPRRVLAAVSNAAPAVLLGTGQAIAATVGLTFVEATPLNAAAVGLIAFDIPDARPVPVVVLALNADPRVQFAQPDFVYDTHGQVTAASAEPYETLSYGARLMGSDRVRGFVSGRGVKVALIDTGVDDEQVDLAEQLSETRDFTGKGFTADIHGTQVAGILAAKPGNGAGISGVAPGASVLALKACQPSSAQSVRARCWSSALVKSLDYAAGQRADLVNLSVGGRQDDRILGLGVQTAIRSGAAVVAAAGNDGPTGAPSYPAALEGVLAVTAVDGRRQIYRHATQGEFVDLAAPGVEIISTAPGNQFPICSGTSFAAAYVTGALALLREGSPSSTAAALVSVLERTAQDLGPSGRDAQFGDGLINACAALRALNPQAPVCD